MALNSPGARSAPFPFLPTGAGRTRLGPALAVLALVALAAWGAYALALRIGLDRLGEAADHRLDMEVSRIEAELARFDYLPALLETSPQVQQLLASPFDPALRAQASHYLHALNAIAGAETLYVLEPGGVAAAASDDGQLGTPAGQNLSYRPYLREALAGGRGRFYGIGVTSRVPGYYLAYALPRGGPVRGVATVKIDLRPAALAWRQLPGEMLLLDEHQVAILASREDWKYRPIAPLPDAERAEAATSRRYGDAPLTPLSWRMAGDGPLEPGPVREVRLDGRSYAATVHRLDAGRWRLVLLSDQGPVRAVAAAAAAGAALAAAALLLGLLVLRQRRRLVRQQLASRAALQAANDSLERRVQERTAELRATQAELVHAGQLAVLGQMSAGMVHELNQPLAALHTLSDNAVLLLERGRSDDARANLTRIAQLVHRLGRLTAQLKVFAHKRTEPPVPVLLERALREAALLHAPRLRELGVDLGTEALPTDLAVMAEETRLVQVLANLVGNAADALADVPVGTRWIAVASALDSAGTCRITVANSGPPIPPEAQARLFEPFFTTKPAGRGLGLGLMMSAHIIQAFGGSLRLARPDEAPEGAGAAFVIELPARPDVPASAPASALRDEP
ncbi:ATP-binding protein [Pseudacidovorax sp. RU35E]|uniref:sensor histidine kinase n=1 Tax=Pseudacidovorax sp. RU35E TaxID=1907403 RepID=UPI0009568AC5|nr:ATP-binding protein [Pseudacidovorax sp. RU35E]SIQ38018.1 two-component system, NtrC family, C4-dicarboxylate transport sensor histidine kinase DctB [Pseudacidovorax sp. RU35E]